MIDKDSVRNMKIVPKSSSYKLLAGVRSYFFYAYLLCISICSGVKILLLKYHLNTLQKFAIIEHPTIIAFYLLLFALYSYPHSILTNSIYQQTVITLFQTMPRSATTTAILSKSQFSIPYKLGTLQVRMSSLPKRQSWGFQSVKFANLTI